MPSPFTIAVLLTFLTYLIALFITKQPDASYAGYALKLLTFWESGLWTGSLLTFTLQMMLMLVLGHALALTQPADRLIRSFIRSFCRDTASAAFTVTFITLMVAWFNWGLGLIFGAIFARKTGEYAARQHIPLNYPLIGAAGYSGLMVWHGGISGSSLSKIAEEGHLRKIMEGTGLSEQSLDALPAAIGYNETVFGSMNLTLTAVLLVAMPLLMFWLGKRCKPTLLNLPTSDLQSKKEQPVVVRGAERMDHSRVLAIGFGLMVVAMAFYRAIDHEHSKALKFITPNWINLLLLGLAITFHTSFFRFLQAIQKAISGASGILIQFPLYFGIMGIMRESGLIELISGGFVEMCARSGSPEQVYPILTLFSAGLVNVFVPSGGGQWAVQGPIIVQAALHLNVPLAKSIMALAYGDQLTNMLQPFWALPLLGITGLKAKEILPYTLLLMALGIVVFTIGLLLF